METSGASVHEASYNAVAGRTAEGRFQCVMTCSCGETRTSSSQVSATQARSNARTAFTRHVKEAETRAREAEEHLAATSAAAEEAARLEAERLAAEEADRLEAERLAAEEAARLEAEEAERLAAEEAAHVDDEPETHESEPEPDEPPASRRASELVVSPALARRARVLAMPAVAAAAAVAAIVVAFTGSDEQPEPPGRVGQVAQQQFDEVPSGTPSTGTTGPAPPTGPGSFVQRLREADPVYERPSTRTLVAAGRRTCQDYKAGQDVVQIVATLANRGHLDPAQARTFIRFSGPAFCPQFVKPMTEELDGLDS